MNAHRALILEMFILRDRARINELFNKFETPCGGYLTLNEEESLSYEDLFDRLAKRQPKKRKRAKLLETPPQFTIIVLEEELRDPEERRDDILISGVSSHQIRPPVYQEPVSYDWEV